MFENILRDLGGIGLIGIVSVCLFFAFFIAILFWAVRLKKPYLKAMENLPLDGSEPADPKPFQTQSDLEISHE